MPRLAKSTSFTVSTPPSPPPPLPHQSLSPFLRFRIPARSLVMIPLPSHLVARSMAPLCRPLVSPLHQTNAQFDMFRDFLSYMERQQAHPSVTTTAVSSFAPVQSTQRLIYTAAQSDRPLSAVVYPPGPFSLPASVSGSGAGGIHGQQGRPLLQEHTNLAYSARLRRASCNPSHEGDRSWGAPFSWGAFGEGAPTAVGDQDYLGPYHGEYYYPSDSYRPHTFEQQPPPFQDSVGADFDPSFPYSANSDADFRSPGTSIIIGGSIPLR